MDLTSFYFFFSKFFLCTAESASVSKCLQFIKTKGDIHPSIHMNQRYSSPIFFSFFSFGWKRLYAQSSLLTRLNFLVSQFLWNIKINVESVFVCFFLVVPVFITIKKEKRSSY